MKPIAFKAIVFFVFVVSSQCFASFHDAPASAMQTKPPAEIKDASFIKKGGELFSKNCASCHGADAMGTGNVPALARGPAQAASAGEVFWFARKGSPENGMPPTTLKDSQLWQVVAFVHSLANQPAKASAPLSAETTKETAKETEGPPPKPFTDYRFERPGVHHKIEATDLPKPAPETSVGNAPAIVKRPADAWPKVPPGFKVELFASSLDNPRLIRTAPNGDIFLAESESGKIRVFRGMTANGQPEKSEVFVSGMDSPYGIAFYPRGNYPKWIYIGNTDAVVRIPYHNGDLKSTGPAQKIASLPHQSRGHWTRDIQFTLDGSKLFVAVGSGSNVDDPDTTPAEKNRADILVMKPEDGSGQKVFASGIRNAGGGLAVNPETGELWASVNERDGLGNNLVPDYITHVQEGGFYGWPWWYIGAHQDPRHEGKHPELKSKVIVPDVLLQPHHASLQLAFYDGNQFPAEYRGDIFSSQHGSWNRTVRTGYELIHVPLHQKAKATGEYEDFMTGFTVDHGHVWGRPVGVTVAQDGSLLVTDDGSNSIWRVSYVGSR